MFRPQKVKTFDPLSPEYALVDSLTSEMIDAITPYVLWWSLLRNDTQQKRDELDTIYGEASSKDGKHVFVTTPTKVSLRLEINPVIKELTRLGIEQIHAIDIYCNIADFLNKNNIPPQPGDVFRISYINEQGQDIFRNIFYTASVIVPVDLFNLRYINWQIYAEQTPMDVVPDYIKNFQTLP